MSPFGQVIPVQGLNFGLPGTISRMGDPLPVAKPVLATTPSSIKFGDPVVVIPNASGGGDTVVNVYDYQLAAISGGQAGTLTAALFAGVAIREVKTMTTFPVTPGTGQSGAYAPGEMCEFLERGTISVKVNVGTPASQGTVYVRITLNGAIPAGVVGGFECASDNGKCIALSGVVFKDGHMDANGITEITLKGRQAA